MIGRWRWVLRLLGVYLLVPVTTTPDGCLVRTRRASLAITFWISLYCINIYTLTSQTLHDKDTSCFSSMNETTFKTYNVKFVIAVYIVSSIVSNSFCIIRLYARKIEHVANRSLVLYDKINVDKFTSSTVCAQVKGLLFCIFVFSLFNSTAILVYCTRNQNIYEMEFWYFLPREFFKSLLSFPGAATATIFFMLLDTSNASLQLICKRLDKLTSFMRPKQFAGVTSINVANMNTKSMVTSRALFSLRMLHDELVILMEDIMKHFQTDILIFFLASFYQNIVHIYSLVYTGIKLFDSNETIVFVWHNLQRSVTLVINLWFVCAGPSRIQAQQRELMSSVSRLSTVTSLPSDVLYEIKILHLQARNHIAQFEVFGMFKLNFSLLFTMCASIVSYIVVLIQFAIEPDQVDATPAQQLSINVSENYSSH